MELLLTLVPAGGEPLPAGCPLTVEVRDTSLADAPATLVARVRTVIPPVEGAGGVRVRMALPAVPDGATVWAHVDADGDGRASRGDWVTTQSHPVARAGTQSLTIRLTKIV